MSVRSKIIAGAASASVLVIGWQAGLATGILNGDTETTTTTTTPSTTTTTPSSTTTTTTSPSSSSSSSSTTTTPSTTQSSSSSSTTTASSNSGWADGVYTGSTTSNQFGTWTVTVTISGGKITDSSYVTTANDGRSKQINASAVPKLKSEVISAQSADVNTVSGATLTSGSYLGSLQSALDQAAA